MKYLPLKEKCGVRALPVSIWARTCQGDRRSDGNGTLYISKKEVYEDAWPGSSK